MTELRARDLYVGAKVRIIGADDETFREVVNFEQRGDDVFLTVDNPGTVPWDLPVLDGDDVVEVES